MHIFRFSRRIIWLTVYFLLTAFSFVQAASPSTPKLIALIVGGGPTEEYNAVEIEGHTKFVISLLPAATRSRVLFADGKADHATVSFLDDSPETDAKRALAILLPKGGIEKPLRTRPPKLGVPIQGAARLPDLRRALTALLPRAEEKSVPLLLYFAGHGSQETGHEENSEYDLWNSEKLKVRDLAQEIARLPATTPVVLVMAQCHSGGFANVLFHDGKADGGPVPQDVVGFFSAQQDREASGCGWETGEPSYQDFSSFFFGALCGHNRFGKKMDGADYDGDGRVSLHEAFCYALCRDDSYDTPLCTSDVFLRRFSTLSDIDVYYQPYKDIWQAATPAQRVALDTLSKSLGLEGEDRALAAYDRLKFRDPIARAPQLEADRKASDALNALRQTTLADLFKRWPALRWDPPSQEFNAAIAGATKELVGNQTMRRDVVVAAQDADITEATLTNEEAWLIRFLGVYGSVVRAKHLREHGESMLKARFQRLWEAEQRSLPINTDAPSTHG